MDAKPSTPGAPGVASASRLSEFSPPGPPSGRFPTCRKLRRPADFEAVRQASRSRECGLFAWQATANPDVGCPTRLGVIASRRVGGAVQRNRCKRLLREVFRLHQNTLPNGLTLVLVARPRLVQAGYAEVEAVFQRLVSPALAKMASSPVHQNPAEGPARATPEQRP